MATESVTQRLLLARLRLPLPSALHAVSRPSPSRSSIGHPDSIWNKDHEAVRFEPGSNQLWLDASLGQQTPEAELSFSFLQLATTAFARPDPGIEALHN